MVPTVHRTLKSLRRTFCLIAFNLVDYLISRRERKERKVITLLLTLEGSQLHATEGAEVDERKTFKV